MEEPQGTGTPSAGQHYREIASKLREIASECRFQERGEKYSILPPD
jgi:hypothetical protein